MNEYLQGRGQGPFGVLVVAAKAIEQRLPEYLEAALQAVPQSALLRVAARHRCLGYLRRGILDLGIRSDRATALVDALRAYTGKAAIQAYAVRAQLTQLVAAFNEDKVPFVLLKGSARLFRGDKEAESDLMYDLDVLVPAQEATRAVAALQHRGYHSELGEWRVERYRAEHHHLAPLQPAGVGLPVELHVQLAPPDTLSTASDWDACTKFFERVVKSGVEATCFNTLGTAVHLAIHGVGLRRFRDVVMLARILHDEAGTHDRVLAALADERWQYIALRAVIALSARVAGIELEPIPAVQRYLTWVMRREDLAPYVRDRSQFADAWYCNGGKLWGPAIRQALPAGRDVEQNAVTYAAVFAFRLIGRIATSAYAALSSSRRFTALP